jgi:hypothetical protein
MANQKYDNLAVMMAGGQLNWLSDAVNAVLVTGATYNSSDTTLSQLQATMAGIVPVPGRAIGPAGSLLGGPVSFGGLSKGVVYQMVITKQSGPGADPMLIAYYDADENNDTLVLQNNGTLIVRPTEEDPTTGNGRWVSI